MGKRKENRHEESLSEAVPSSDKEKGSKDRRGCAGGCGAVDPGSFGSAAGDAGGTAPFGRDSGSGAGRADDERRSGEVMRQSLQTSGRASSTRYGGQQGVIT